MVTVRCLCVQVGAQNAGKSSLINAMRRAVGRKRPQEELTTAPLPGTTLGAFLSTLPGNTAVATLLGRATLLLHSLTRLRLVRLGECPANKHWRTA